MGIKCIGCEFKMSSRLLMALSFALLAFGIAAGCRSLRTAASLDTAKSKYVVIDLAALKEGANNPLSALSEVPDGGWTDEYKTKKMVFRRIMPGEFLMGGRFAVKITKPYYIGVFEVTQSQYALFMGEEPWKELGDCSWHYNPSRWPTLPVQDMSYNLLRGSCKGALWPRSAEVDPESFIGKLRGLLKKAWICRRRPNGSMLAEPV